MSETRHYDIFILGGGPAGLTAAIYGARTNLKTGLIERERYGGQLSGTDTVENFPGFAEAVGGGELSESMHGQAERFGAEFLFGEVRGVRVEKDGMKVLDTSEGEIRTKALIVATGSRPKLLEAPGEEKFWGKGISTCATCDGAFFKGKEVVVIGGGDAAVEEGGFLTNFATKVTVVHRRDALRATPLLQERAFKNPKIAFQWDSVVTRYLGDKKLEGVEVENVKTGEKGELRAPGVFIFIGHIPNTDFLNGLLPLDEHGYIKAEWNTKTPVPGVYAAGDNRVGAYRQAVTAAADGCMAAINSQHYVAAWGEKHE